jgi:predicted dehydrogenase
MTNVFVVKKLNIGLIGCGRVSELHMLAYKNISEANVIAVSDINLDRAKAFAEKHGIEKAIKDSSDLFEIKNLDYVDICTPTSTHPKIACEAAKYGHNILLEKPMARTTTECDKIIHDVSRQGVKLCICHNQIFLPHIMNVKAMVDSGEFPLEYFRVSVRESAELIGAPNWIMTPEHGGVLWETGAHAAYLQLHFLKDIKEISAVGYKINNPVYDHFVVQLTTQNNAIGLIEISWLAKKQEIIHKFVSSDGKQVQVMDYGFPLEIPENPKSFLQGFYGDQKMIIKKWVKFLSSNLRHLNVLTCLPQYILFDKYIDSIKNDLDPPVTPEDGRKTIELLECIKESLDNNQSVKLH